MSVTWRLKRGRVNFHSAEVEQVVDESCQTCDFIVNHVAEHLLLFHVIDLTQGKHFGVGLDICHGGSQFVGRRIHELIAHLVCHLLLGYIANGPDVPSAVRPSVAGKRCPTYSDHDR